MKPTNSNGTHRPAGPQLPCDNVLKSVLAKRKLSNSVYETRCSRDSYQNVISFEAYKAQRKREKRQRRVGYVCMMTNVILWVVVGAGFGIMLAVMHGEQQQMEQQLTVPLRP